MMLFAWLGFLSLITLLKANQVIGFSTNSSLRFGVNGPSLGVVDDMLVLTGSLVEVNPLIPCASVGLSDLQDYTITPVNLFAEDRNGRLLYTVEDSISGDVYASFHKEFRDAAVAYRDNGALFPISAYTSTNTPCGFYQVKRWADGAEVPAKIREYLTFHKQQSISSGGDTVFTGITPSVDTLNGFDGNQIYTFQNSGRFILDVWLQWTVNSISLRTFAYSINGNTPVRIISMQGISSTVLSQGVTVHVDVNAGETIEFLAGQWTGGSEGITMQVFMYQLDV